MSYTQEGSSSRVTSAGLVTYDQGAAITAATSITVTNSVHEVSGSATITTISGGRSGMALRLLAATGSTWSLGSGGNIKCVTTQSTPERYYDLFTPDGTSWYLDTGIKKLAWSDDFSVTTAIEGESYSVDLSASALPNISPLTTKGDLLTYASAHARQGVGANGTILIADSTQTNGIKWSQPTDAEFIVTGSADATKKARLEVDGVTAGQTRVITVPDSNTTIPIFSQPITFSGPTAARTVTLPDAATTVPIASQQLTFSGPTASRTVTLPDAAFTVAGTNVAQSFTTAQTFTGNVIVGSSGGTIASMLFGSATLDFPDTASGAAADLTITVTGAATGDAVMALGIPANALSAGGTDAYGFYAFVSGTDTVTVRFWNAAGLNINPGSGTFKVWVIK